jgi:general secretion pathway protein G
MRGPIEQKCRGLSVSTQPGKPVLLGAQAGLTLIELIVACGILLVLATAALPVARYTVMRQKEAELRSDLREMRDAIDRYKDASDRNLIRVAAGTEGYPPDLETLVNGVEIISQPNSGQGALPAQGVQAGNSPIASPSSSGNPADEEAIHRVRFLRRIPEDPMTGHMEWGLRAVQDDPDSTSWGGKNVFDVYSLSQGMALDGTRYQDW